MPRKPRLKKSARSADAKPRPAKQGALAQMTAKARGGDEKMIFKDVVKAARAADGFENFVSRLGVPANNTLSAGTYDFNYITRNRILLEAAYRGSWIVGAIIDNPAIDMTRAGIEITTVTKDDEQIKKIQSAMSRLQVWRSFCLLKKWGGLYGGAIGVIQIKGQDLSTPLELDTIDIGQFQGIVVYDRWQLNPVLIDVIEDGPETGLPKFYQIVNNPTMVDPTAQPATGLDHIHHSRAIRNVGYDLPYLQAITEMMWGESIIERLFDRLISFDNATMSTASLIDRANLRTVGVEGLREIIAAGGEAYQGLIQFFEMIRELQGNMGLTILDKNDEFKTDSYTFTGLPDILLQFAQQLSGGSGQPLIRLFCQSPAGLNATGDNDLRMYYDNINSMQESEFRNGMEIVLKVMWRSTFGKPAPDDMEFTFVPLWQQTPTDKATNAKTTVETILAAADVVGAEVTLSELRDTSGDTGLFSGITDEQIAEGKDLDENPPDPSELMPGGAESPSGESSGGEKAPPPGAQPEPPKAPAPQKEKGKDSKPQSSFERITAWLSRN